jgi:2-keto-4-pentenoate hydratase/2-oxohepta-3-ene-1,7-dioic acid hydratase in catechol pathway
MRQVRFRDETGQECTGEWTDDGIEYGGRTYDPGAVDVLPPSDPTKVLVLDSNQEFVTDASEHSPPPAPRYFMKTPNSVVGHEDTVRLPPVERDGICEAELAVVIGEQCRNVSEADVSDVILGYTCTNDLLLEGEGGAGSSEGDPADVRRNNFDTSNPLGPVVATPDEVPDDPDITLWINGEEKAVGGVAGQIFSIEEIVADVTKYVTLEAGDTIIVGSAMPAFTVTDGDEVDIEVEGIGTLRHYVSEPEATYEEYPGLV